jgi:hemerythrin
MIHAADTDAPVVPAFSCAAANPGPLRRGTFHSLRSQGMPMFVWEDKYSLQIAEIDRQHQKLFALFNELYEAMQDGHAREVIDKVLTSVIDYTVYHFAFEEKLLREAGFKEEAAHRAEHAKLAEQAKALALKLKQAGNDTTVVIATLKLLGEWLTRHIMVSDKQFAPFLIARGVR